MCVWGGEVCIHVVSYAGDKEHDGRGDEEKKGAEQATQREKHKKKRIESMWSEV